MPLRMSAEVGYGFSLKNFLDMCQEALLVGAPLSHVQVRCT